MTLAAVLRGRRRPEPPAPPAMPLAAPTMPQPAWHPAETAPQPALARPYVREPAQVAALIYDRLIEEMPPAPEPAPPPPPPPPGTSVLPYCAPGWTRVLSAIRIRSGEWADWPAVAEAGLGRSYAAEAAGYRHNTQRISAGWQWLCLAAGRPDLADPGLERIGWYVGQLRREQQRGRARRPAGHRRTP